MKGIDLVINKMRTKEEKMICAEMIANSKPWTTLGITYDQVMITLEDTLNEVFVSYIKEEIVGTIIIQTKGAFSGYLKSIAVKTGWRDKHLGKLMMEFIENQIFSKSANVFLCVSSFNLNAQKFYLKLGYEIIGELKNYMVEGHNEILMRKTIGPILEKS